MEFSLDQLRADLRGLSPQQHGFTYLDLDRRRQSTGRLSGWILSAKDLNDVAGMPTSLGSVHRRYLAKETDPFLAGLEAEGALIVGKSAAPELGLRVDTEPVGLIHPQNPLHPGATPGGSSGGAAVQVARGLLRAAHATDGGGSIRVPAAACGVVGFKPAGTDLTAAGFITRSVADAAFLHAKTPKVPRARIGVLVEPLFAQTAVDPVMLRAVNEATARLEGAGFETVAISAYPQAGHSFQTFQDLFTYRLRAVPDAAGYVEWLRAKGQRVSAAEYTQARAHSRALPELLALHWQVDAILTPMLAFDPPPLGSFRSRPHQANFDAQTRWSPWGSLFNLAHLPAISIPWAVSDRAPVGLQLGAITLDDAALLGLAGVLHS